MKGLLITAIIGGLAGGLGHRLIVRNQDPAVANVEAHRDAPLTALVPASAPDPTPIDFQLERSGLTTSDVLEAAPPELLIKLSIFLPDAIAEDMPVLAEALGVSADQHPYQLRRQVFARWVELDPAAMLDWVRSKKGDAKFTDGNSLMIIALQIWCQVAPREAFAIAITELSKKDLPSILSKIALEHSAVAIDLASANGLDLGEYNRNVSFDEFSTAELEELAPKAMKLGEATLKSFATTWAEKDPAAAFAWADGQKATHQRNLAIAAVLGSIADSDPTRATEMANTLPPSRARGLAILKIAEKLAKKSPDEALSWAKSLLPGSERQAAFARLADSVQNKWDPKAAIAVLDGLNWHVPGNLAVGTAYHVSANGGQGGWFSEHIDSSAAVSILTRLAETSPEEATEYAFRISPHEERQTILGQTIQKWAAKDPRAALDWATGRDGIDTVRGQIEIVAQNFFEADPDGAKDWIAQIPADLPIAEFASEAIARQLAATDPTAALTLAETLPAPGKAKHAAWEQWITAEPEAAAGQALALGLLDSEELTDTANKLFIRLSGKNPTAAIALLESVPEERAGAFGRAWETVATNYGHSDLKAASEWVAELPTGKERDSAITGLLEHLSNINPDHEAAILWASEISDSSLQPIAMRNAREAWLSRDPEKARQQISESDLPEDMKSDLLQTISP